MADLREQIARKIAARLGHNFETLPANRAIRLQYVRSGGSPAHHTKDDLLKAADDILELAEVRDAVRPWAMLRRRPEVSATRL